jgi:SAM-dependent methyltransferase
MSSGVFRVGAEAYDDFMGRYAVRLAPLFADFAGVGAGQRVLDVGAGTGALAGELVRRGADVTAAEPSPEFVAALRERFPAVDAQQAPAEDLPFPDGAFDAALAQLVVAFMADAPRGVAEMGRVAQTVAVCMWSVGEMEMFAAINRTAEAIGVERGEAGARRYRTREELVELLAPLGRVETANLDVEGSYTGFDEFWNAMSRQVGPAGAWVAAMDDEQKRAAREQLFRELGSPDGTFDLDARCYAARVSTDARSAPVPTSVTSTSSSRSTNST